MKTIINISKRDYKIIGISLIAGLFLGWLFFHNSRTGEKTIQKTQEHIHEEATVWTCSMHPQIKLDKPGKCPICAMDLIPLEDYSGRGEAISPDEIQMTDVAIKIADVQTIIVKRDYSSKEVYLLGKVKPDERNIAELTARFGGRIETLFVNFTGQNVRKGDKLATVYSPELVTAQKELLEAVEYRQSNPSFYNAVRNKFKSWDLTDEQINSIEEKGEPQIYFDILSPISGTVTIRYVALGDYIKEGSALFRVIDLSKVWVMFEAYESDLPWLSIGDNVEFTVQSLPGKEFTGRLTYIDPFINAKTRIANVRVEVINHRLELKPEMFANGVVKPELSVSQKNLLIPKTSILWTGKRAVVYVKIPGREQPSFLYREITLGPEAGRFYIVKKGLAEGEEIVVNGVFKIDAAAQLAGLPSMMNPSSAKTSEGKPKGGKISAGHDHGGMDMSSESSKQDNDTHSKYTPVQSHEANIQHKMFKVAGNCSMCKTRIEEAALSLDGVNSAEWNIDTKIIHLSFNADKVKLDNIHKAIAEVGHDTEEQKAPEDVYNKLPECCKYTRE